MIRECIRLALVGGMLAGLGLALSGCLLSPGAFTSRLELRQERTFSYSYEGEIHFLALSKLAEMGAQSESGPDEFSAEPCYDDEPFKERACTSEEIAEQERAWQEGREARVQKREREAEMMRAMLGGLDPADPRAASEMAARLERQRGWNKVIPRGDGLFEVSFAISGPLGHDFVFPTMEGFPIANTFVQIALRDDETVRVDAPGFAAQAAANPYQGMMAGMASAFSAGGEGQDEIPRMPAIDGTFTLVTDGEILANNTDEGPRHTPAGRTLEWRINERTRSAPMALVRLGG